MQAPIAQSNRPETTILLALAAWLIFNSHLEAFYPFPWLAADGLLGNSMFFVISGFGIFSSLSIRKQGFLEYSQRRIWRLYPVILIVLAFQAAFIVHLSDPSLTGIFKTFFWPTSFTYVQIIVPLYFIAYMLFRLGPGFMLGTLLLISMMIYGLSYFETSGSLLPGAHLQIGKLPDLVSYSFFTLAFTLGAFMTERKTIFVMHWHGLMMLVLVLCVYVFLKYLMVVQGMATKYYPVLHFLVLAACAICLKNLCDPKLYELSQRIPFLGAFMRKSGQMSLEIYAIHSVLLGIAFFQKIVFPLNIVFFAATTFLLSTGLAKVVANLRSRFET